MVSASLVEQVKGRWREFRREPSAFFFVLFMPIFWMVALGFGLSGRGDETYGVGWVAAESQTPLVADVRTALEDARNIRLSVGPADSLTPELRRGDVLVLVDLSPDGLRYVYDPKNHEARRARDAVDAIAQEAAGRRDVLKSEDRPVDVPGSRYVDFLVPGLLALSIMSTSILGTGITLVANRRDNLLKRYLVTPMPPYEYLLSHVIGRLIILAFELVTTLTAAALIFDFRIAGSLVDFVIVAVAGTAALTAIGILVGSRATNAAVMSGLSNVVTVPMMIFAGVWFSRADLPDWLAKAARWLPLTPLVDGLRRIALEGAGIAALGPELGIMALYFTGAAIAAKALFKWH